MRVCRLLPRALAKGAASTLGAIPQARLERLAVPIAVAGGMGFTALLWAGQVGIGLIGAPPEPASQLFSDTTRSLGVSKVSSCSVLCSPSDS